MIFWYFGPRPNQSESANNLTPKSAARLTPARVEVRVLHLVRRVAEEVERRRGRGRGTAALELLPERLDLGFN